MQFRCLPLVRRLEFSNSSPTTSHRLFPAYAPALAAVYPILLVHRAIRSRDMRTAANNSLCASWRYITDVYLSSVFVARSNLRLPVLRFRGADVTRVWPLHASYAAFRFIHMWTTSRVSTRTTATTPLRAPSYRWSRGGQCVRRRVILSATDSRLGSLLYQQRTPFPYTGLVALPCNRIDERVTSGWFLGIIRQLKQPR